MNKLLARFGRIPYPARVFFYSLLALAGLASASLSAQKPQSSPSAPSLPDQILVKLHHHVPETAWRAIEQAHGLQQRGAVEAIGVRVVKVPAHHRDTVLEALSRNPHVEFAEPDFTASLLLTPNDPRYPEQWHLPRIKGPDAWKVTTGRADQVIAILDTGVNSNHADLRAKMLPGYNFIANTTNASDDHGHGTLVAGAAAAIGNNAEGVAGVAFTNWVMPVKVLDSAGNGSHSAIANGITYAADNGARVINLSLGSASSSRTLQSAVNYAWNKNAVIVAAAGNSGDTTLHYPAAYSNVIGVSALDGNDRLPSWATHGSHVALSAPGVSILSTTRGGGYGASSGSSFASPLVAGAAGLVLAVAPTLSNVAVVDILQTTADDLGAAGYDTLYGHGRVNASAAVQKAAGSAPKDTTAPTVAIVSPREGATVAGTVGVEIDAHDNVGVSRVELYLNGTLFASSTHAVTTLAWDTTKSADGDYRLEARAYDAAGNVGTSAAVRVKVANTPPPAPAIPLTVAIVSPADGSTVSKNVKIDVAAQGGSGTINRIELYINGTLHGTATASPASFTWNTNRIPSGSYRLQAFARDSSGAIAESAVITVRR